MEPLEQEDSAPGKYVLLKPQADDDEEDTAESLAIRTVSLRFMLDLYEFFIIKISSKLPVTLFEDLEPNRSVVR